MHDFIMAEDSELWDEICDGPFVPMKTISVGTVTIPKTRKEYTHADRKSIEKNFRVKQSKIDMLNTEYKLFEIKEDEYIQDMHTRFTSIINELHSLGEVIPRNKLV
ncbi:uncharacterized protein [Nicotiana sylvestris]|uniref:uncharacterized protein n=1 Tax=Nicotiana sylvestris TaxID=4096 RepID=UPI00388C45CC